MLGNGARLLVLPKLEYGYDALQPHISEQQLTLHHDKHHAAYVNGANALFETLDRARKENADVDSKAVAKTLSFNLGGHMLHSLFWKCMAPPAARETEPGGKLADALKAEFGSFERFRKEFTQAATSVEGSGWAVLAYCKQVGRPVIMQLEKHNVNAVPGLKPLFVLDVWEHAYYLDYKNDRAKFVEAFWNVSDWKEAEAKFERMASKG